MSSASSPDRLFERAIQLASSLREDKVAIEELVDLAHGSQEVLQEARRFGEQGLEEKLETESAIALSLLAAAAIKAGQSPNIRGPRR